MKIITVMNTGMLRSWKTWKGIIIIWLVSLLLVSLVSMPMRSALRTGFGSSMITEKLATGINVEVFADLGSSFGSLVSYFSVGLILVLLIGFLFNSFISGGIFGRLKKISGGFSYNEFFITSVKYFWSFLIISLIISLIIVFLAIVIIVIPVSVVSQSQPSSEGAAFKTGIVVTSLFLVIFPLLLLVADYARAWQVLNDENQCFKALGFGFRHTFRTFSYSYPLMIILLLVQGFYGWFVLSVLAVIRPVDGIGIILLFILSQFLFFLKILLRTWRYGSVTYMMELTV
jgi:hypothetical protein